MISDQLRVKQGPLARVWLASHWERKISKSQFLQTNLEKTIDVITTNQEEEPITLRVSGQLLLGVVRIFSRKTKYLLEDCNEALVKIKLAFKKGDVNMPDIHQTVANVNTITLQDKLTEFDILLPDLPFNSNINSGERDPILDTLNDISMSQSINLGEMNSFSFGNWETGRGVDGVEVGRRDNEAALADPGLDFDAIADPLKDMNLNDDQNGLFNDGVDFDFDMDDNIDYGGDFNNEAGFNPNAEFDAQFDEPTDASLMNIGIVEDSQLAFDDFTPEPTVRRRKRLVVDKITEIPTDDLRRYANSAQTIVSKDTQLVTKKKTSNAVNLSQPFGGSIGSELESMFTSLSRKRRASTSINQGNKEARFDVNTPGGPTPGGPGVTSAFHFDDNGDFGGDDDYGFDAGFNEDAAANMDGTNELSFMSQTQSFNSKTRETFEKLEGQFSTQKVVKFGELATSSCKKSEAARLFYDVLLLSTKDKIKVQQDRPFGEIQISAVTV